MCESARGHVSGFLRSELPPRCADGVPQGLAHPRRIATRLEPQPLPEPAVVQLPAVGEKCRALPLLGRYHLDRRTGPGRLDDHVGHIFPGHVGAGEVENPPAAFRCAEERLDGQVEILLAEEAPAADFFQNPRHPRSHHGHHQPRGDPPGGARRSWRRTPTRTGGW